MIYIDNHERYGLMVSSEIPLTSKTDYIIGYIDVAIDYGRGSPSLYVEAKPKIKSFGETLRQIRTYKNYRDYNVKYVIYSPDTRFKAAFESQGIKFVTPSDIGINM